MSEESTTTNEAEMLSTNREIYLDVTAEQYETMKAKGIEEELLFKPGRHIFRRRPAHKILKQTQTTVVLNLDEETIAYFQRRADEQNAATIEAQIAADIRRLAQREAA